jgi:hypothetical protein
VKRDARELRHLRFAFPQYLLKFLGAELTSISATEYAIVVIVWHTFLLSTFGLLMITPEARWMLDNDNPRASIQFQIGTRSV